nr:hypothetical protein CFP56_36241 [Quercus suber]
MAVNKNRTPHPSAPRRSKDDSLGSSNTRPPWEAQNIPQVPFSKSTSRKSSDPDVNAPSALWTAQTNRNLAIHLPTNDSAHTLGSSTTQWSTAGTPSSTTTPATATTWSSYCSRSQAETNLSLRPHAKSKSGAWPTTAQSVPAVSETIRPDRTLLYPPMGLPAGPRTAPLSHPYAKVPLPPSSDPQPVRPPLPPPKTSESRSIGHPHLSTSHREAPPLPNSRPNESHDASLHEPDKSLGKRIKSFFQTTFRRKHDDDPDEVLHIQTTHWTDDY